MVRAVLILFTIASGQDLFLVRPDAAPTRPGQMATTWSKTIGEYGGPLSETVTLRGGVVMPSVSLGSSGLCHPDPDGTERTCTIYNATLMALQNGYRGLHDALSYGNQAGVGAAVRDSGILRKELFLMSMVPKYLMGYNETKASVAASMAQLQVDYLDLVMVHHRAATASEWPQVVQSMKAFPDNWARLGSPVNNLPWAAWQPPACALQDGSWLTCQDETWKALTELKAAGKVRAIGVSNWMVSNLQRMVDLGQELPAVNQIEQHVGWWDGEMIDWCSKHGVVVQAATPLARANPSIIGSKANHVVQDIALKYNKSTAQVALRFLIEKGVAIIPHSASTKYQKENLALFDFRLSHDDMRDLGVVSFACRDCDNCVKCWGDPAALMCTNPSTGAMFHCP